MQKIISAVCCLLGVAGLVQAGEAKPPTEKELEKALAAVQTYLGRDPAKLAAELKPEELRAADEGAAVVLKHVGGLPEDSPVRLKAVALARKYAAVTDYPDPDLLAKKRSDGVDYHPCYQAHTGLYFAWGVLRETKVLRDGMRLEEVVALLGPPTKITSDYAEWYYRSPMHVNPCLLYFKVDKGDEKRKKGSIEVH
jgi:hypothetical protein